jgi:hypothetical protein
MRAWILLSLGFVLLSTSPVSAQSVLGYCSLNGVTVSSDVTVRYNGAGSTAADAASGNDSRLVVVPSPTSGTAAANALLFPAGGGGPKDQIDGTLKSSFEFGPPFGSLTQDILIFNAAGNSSAENALNSAGNPAAAEVTGEARAEFFIDIVAGRDCDTFFTVPEVRALEPYETLLEINVIMDPNGAIPVLLATLGPGSPAQNILLPEDHAFLIQLNYDHAVPFGIDPPFDFSYVVTVGPAPTVPALDMQAKMIVGLLILGTVLLRAGLRRRAAAAGH